jgi:hypothetical protein
MRTGRSQSLFPHTFAGLVLVAIGNFRQARSAMVSCEKNERLRFRRSWGDGRSLTDMALIDCDVPNIVLETYRIVRCGYPYEKAKAAAWRFDAIR